MTESVQIGGDDYIAATRVLPPSSKPRTGSRGRREDALGNGDHPAVAHRAAAVSLGRPPERDRWSPLPRCWRRSWRATPSPAPSRGRSARSPPRCARWRRPATYPPVPLPSGTPLGRRGRAAAGDDVQLDDRLDRTLSARGGAARAPVVARPALDRGRARDPQPADDHQDLAARAAARDVRPTSVRAAVADIDEEVTRLNRIVTDVLDFARPIRFDLAPADLNALCADAARAAGGRMRRAASISTSPPSCRRSMTDAERLRLALVNVLANAQQAVARRRRAPLPTRCA